MKAAPSLIATCEQAALDLLARNLTPHGILAASATKAAQAKRYATKLALRYTDASNGQAIYGIDTLTGSEGEVMASVRMGASAGLTLL